MEENTLYLRIYDKGKICFGGYFWIRSMLNILFKEVSNTEKFYSINYLIRVVSTLYTLYTLFNLKGMLKL